MLFLNIYIYFLVGSILSVPAFAANMVTCKVTQSDYAPFSHFIGGKVSIDLETGNNRLSAFDENGNTLQYISIGDDLVSTFGVKRETCKTSVKTERDERGQMQSAQFLFENCEYRSSSTPNASGYVSVTQTLNLETNRGIYQEVFVDGGEAKSPNFFFSDCSIL